MQNPLTVAAGRCAGHIESTDPRRIMTVADPAYGRNEGRSNLMNILLSDSLADTIAEFI